MNGPLVGIVGGLGPVAHLDLERKILDEAQARAENAHTPMRDQDYPPWVLVSLPWTPDRTPAVLKKGKSPVPALNNAVSRLRRAGADYIVIACNTSHAFIDDIRTKLPIVNMVDICVEAVGKRVKSGNVGVLATTGTLTSRVYHRALEQRGLRGVTPLDLVDDGGVVQRTCVMEPIYGPSASPDLYSRLAGNQYRGIKAGGKTGDALPQFKTATARLIEAFGIQAVIAGCTEIPLAVDSDLDRERRWTSLHNLPVYDPARLVAELVVQRWTSR